MKKYVLIGLVVVALIVAAVVIRVEHKRAAIRTSAGATNELGAPTGAADADSAPSDTPFAVIPIKSRLLAPDFTLWTADGKKVTLSKAVQSGPVVLDFWASYCGPCRMGIPHLEAMHRHYSAKGIQFYGVNNYDNADTIKKIDHVMQISFPTLVDSTAVVSMHYGVNSIPMTLIIGRQRHVLAGCMGFDPEMDTDLGSTLDHVTTMKSDMERVN